MSGQFEVASNGLRIRGVLDLPPEQGRHPCVILSHGLVSSMESEKFIHLSDVLTKHRMAACRFDYQGCGSSEGRIEETTLTARVKNLEAVCEWVRSRPSIDPDRCGLLGSSFGGSTSLVKAARDARIKCVALWATPYRIGTREENSTEEVSFGDDLFDDFATYDLLTEAKKISSGLVIHGKLDEVVPYGEGEAIFRCLGEPRRLELVEGGDHRFSDPKHRDRAVSVSLEWFWNSLF
jgi:dipeptidyl aminopeptidase/acylaminoacyl peptidase